jgi:hypothetical protein
MIHMNPNFKSVSGCRVLIGIDSGMVSVPFILIFPFSHSSDPIALGDVGKIVQSHLIKGISLTFGPVTARLIEYGIARLRPEHHGEIVEPLAFLSLVQWLENQPDLNLLARLRSDLSEQDLRGSAYEGLVILYLLRAFRYPVPLSSVFDFHGIPPMWADDMVNIVAHLEGTDVSVGTLSDAPQNQSVGVVEHAASIEDILHWVEDPPAEKVSAAAVLVPGILFGPDVLIRCGDVLLMGQLKSYLDGNKNSLNAKTLCEALQSLNENHWFKQAVRSLISLLNTIHTL